MKHKPMCLITSLLVIIGGINWGLVGLGGFLDKDLNVIKMALGTWPMVLWIVYILVGLSALAMAFFFFKCSECCAYNSSCCGKGKEEKSEEAAPAEPPAEEPAPEEPKEE